MATKYWRNTILNTTWAWDDPAHWSDTNGGPVGATPPTIYDDVVVSDVNNTAGFIDVGVNSPAACRNYSVISNINHVFRTPLYVYGDFTTGSLDSVPTTLYLKGTGVHSAVTWYFYDVIVDCGAGTYDMYASTMRVLTLTSGTILWVNKLASTWDRVVTTGDSPKRIDISGSLVTIVSYTAPTLPVIDFAGTNVSLVATGSTITFSGAANINGGGQSFGTVRFASPSVSGATFLITGANSYENLYLEAPTSSGMCEYLFRDDQVIFGALTSRVNTLVRRRTRIAADPSIGRAVTLTIGTVGLLTNIDFWNIKIESQAAPISGRFLGDCGGNTNILFGAQKTVYLTSTGTTANTNGATWAFTAGGASDQNAYPLPQDIAVITDASMPTAGSTLTISKSASVPTLDVTARTTALTIALTSVNVAVFGSIRTSPAVAITGTQRVVFAGQRSQVLSLGAGSWPAGIDIDCRNSALTLEGSVSVLGQVNLLSGTLSLSGYTFRAVASPTAFTVSNVVAPTRIAFGGGVLQVEGNLTVQTDAPFTAESNGVIQMHAPYTITIRDNTQVYPELRLFNSNAYVSSVKLVGTTNFSALTRASGSTGVSLELQANAIAKFVTVAFSGTEGYRNEIRGLYAGSPATIKKVTPWNVGVHSTDIGNTAGLSFTAGDLDYIDFENIVAELLPTGDMDAAATGESAIVDMAGGVWQNENDGQAPEWEPVDDSQSPGWVPAADAQSPRWTS